MKNILTGFVLTWQFFTVIPIKKTLPMNEKSVTWMFGWLPAIGLILGAFVAVFSGLVAFFDFNVLLQAILVLIFSLFLTGGIHLDGFVDTSDAFFSYADKEKRLAILDDPRIGAFGAISLVCLLLLKVGILYEVMLQRESLLIYFILVPFLSRIAIQLLFNSTSPSKETGLGAYFKKNVQAKTIWLLIGVYCISIISYSIITTTWIPLVLLVVMLFGTFLYKLWITKNFGGVSGDLMGALFEIMEVLLWMIVLLCI